MVEALLLDMGEILLELDFAPMVRGLGFGETTTVGEALQQLNAWDLYDRYERGGIGEAEFHRAVVEKVGRDIPHPEFLKLWNSVIVGPVAGIEGLLDRLYERLPVYALTNTNESHIRHCLEEYPWLKKLRHIFTSHELRARKPEPEVYEAVCAAIQMPPSEILFVDDRPENVEGARAVGMQAEVCARPHHLGEILKRYGLP